MTRDSAVVFSAVGVYSESGKEGCWLYSVTKSCFRIGLGAGRKKKKKERKAFFSIHSENRSVSWGTYQIGEGRPRGADQIGQKKGKW